MEAPGIVALRVVVVGDGAVGKSAFISAAAQATESGPVGTAGAVTVTVPLPAVNDDDLRTPRTTLYSRAQLCLVLYSIVAPHSYENVRSRWLPELRRCAPDLPLLLVGTKADLRHDVVARDRLAARRMECVTEMQGESMRRELGALAYHECTALMPASVLTVLTEVARLASSPTPATKDCTSDCHCDIV